MKNTDWIKGAVIYQIYPDSFAKAGDAGIAGVFEKWDSPPTPYGFKGGNLKGAEQKLDYLRGLGVDAVYFNPVFTSAANHRYHTHDYYTVDPILGGNKALKSFIDAAHRRGIKVILDGVFNHASRGFFQFNHVLENGPDSPYRNWWRVQSYPVKAYNLSGGEKPNYHCWWDLPALPKFNTKNPEVRKFILDVAAFWLKFGIDGWRLDVPHEINDDSFWREFRRVCKKINPGCYIAGEIWGPAQRWLRGDQFDAVMNYQLSSACIAHFGAEKLKLSHLYDGRKLRPMGQKAFMAAIEKLLGLYNWETTLVQMNIMSSHDTDRTADTYGHDAQRARLAAVFSFLFPGAINVYYGEEIGLQGTLDHGTRRTMPWNDKKQWDLELLKLYKQLAALRRGSPALQSGKFAFLREYCDGSVLAFRRFLPGAGQVVCFLNNSGALREMSVAAAALEKAGPLKISCGFGLKACGNKYSLKMAPGAYAVFAGK
ncbi:MAG TPA: glycoside hydrolase family 13 protein [Elusimicrobiales bacterium]|nr:glycoside hydrolase family 13 protein [Elusimicrobiales bacterium]